MKAKNLFISITTMLFLYSVNSLAMENRISRNEIEDIISGQFDDLMSHLKGKYDQKGTNKLQGGLHLLESLNEFTEKNDGLNKESEKYIMKNGVIILIFSNPQDVFNKGARDNMKAFAKSNKSYIENAKTLFPSNWTEDDINEVIVDIIIESIESGKLVLDKNKFKHHIKGGQPFTISRNIDDMDIIVSFAGGEMISAYPLWMDKYADEVNVQKFQAKKLSDITDVNVISEDLLENNPELAGDMLSLSLFYKIN